MSTPTADPLWPAERIDAHIEQVRRSRLYVWGDFDEEDMRQVVGAVVQEYEQELTSLRQRLAELKGDRQEARGDTHTD